MTQQFFDAVLNISGNAAERASNIQRQVRGMNEEMRRAGRLFARRGEALLGRPSLAAQEIREGITPDAEAINLARKLGFELKKLANEGRLTASQMQRLSIAFQNISTGSAAGTRAVRTLGRQLQKASAEMRVAENQLEQTGRRMEFMGDVSVQTAKGVRLMGSAAQGTLLGLALMERNIMGVAFSLIFLQFSGALRLSLAFAGLAAAGNILMKVLTGVFQRRKEAKDLAQAFQVVTGGAQAGALVISAMEEAVKNLGFTQGNLAKEFTKGLSNAFLRLREQGIEPTIDLLAIFVDLMARDMVVNGRKAEDAMVDAEKAVVDFAKGGSKGTIAAQDLEFSLERLSREGAEAVGILRKRVNVDLEKLQQALDSVDATFIPNHIRRILSEVSGEFETATNDQIAALVTFVQGYGAKMEDLVKSTDQTMLDIIAAFEGISVGAAENLGIEGRANRAVQNLIDKLNEMGPAAKDAREITLREFRALSEESQQILRDMENNLAQFGFPRLFPPGEGNVSDDPIEVRDAAREVVEEAVGNLAGIGSPGIVPIQPEIGLPVGARGNPGGSPALIPGQPVIIEIPGEDLEGRIGAPELFPRTLLPDFPDAPSTIFDNPNKNITLTLNIDIHDNQVGSDEDLANATADQIMAAINRTTKLGVLPPGLG